MKSDPDLTILLPARNEAGAIGLLLDEIKRKVEVPHTVLVCNNGSTDETESIAVDKGARVIHASQKGKGNTVRAALLHVTTPYVVIIDADCTYPPAHANLVYESLWSHADVAIGCRTFKEKGSMSTINLIGNWLLSLLASVLYRKRVYDVCSGMWGFRKEVLDEFVLTSKGFTLEAELFINVASNGYRLHQVPIVYRKRADGTTTKLRVIDGFKIGWFLLRGRCKMRRQVHH